ncbi:hypothetical protein PF005_g7686 [Phytophthora fragariae]|uniref:Secreted protein n=1 Tax=Phytophthora fragariae TaxID=53985 RepID=A0A6A4DH62_9STRA|nr:hypothetical protein PF003_g36387 [Phytophthora fragariae]KAE8941671.1 hypothetical protein PF009_g8544 [Phytophthora fragariae]KAE9005113.1 hypothetical protein PF011_g12177 [Phytophthora fragariae]KAE9108884.1 hypothetical protein PF007_g12474 [Phytophthora fragariae]KAE9139960.1 hypothetical protein PF006_g13636 [Phytophthora fragariae]
MKSLFLLEQLLFFSSLSTVDSVSFTSTVCTSALVSHRLNRPEFFTVITSSTDRTTGEHDFCVKPHVHI